MIRDFYYDANGLAWPTPEYLERERQAKAPRMALAADPCHDFEHDDLLREGRALERAARHQREFD